MSVNLLHLSFKNVCIFDNHETHHVLDSTYMHFSPFYIHFIFLCSVMLVFCLCWRYFLIRSWHMRKQSKSGQKQKKWHLNMKKINEGRSGTCGVRHRGMAFAMTPFVIHVPHVALVAFSMRPWRSPWASCPEKL